MRCTINPITKVPNQIIQFTHTYAHTHAHTHAHMHAHMHACTHARMHAHTRTHTHTAITACLQALPLRVLCHRRRTFWEWLLGIVSRKPSQIHVLERNQQLSKDQLYSSP